MQLSTQYLKAENMDEHELDDVRLAYFKSTYVRYTTQDT
jgi:hypothetical protein